MAHDDVTPDRALPGPFDETGPVHAGPLDETGSTVGHPPGRGSSGARTRRPEVPRRGARLAGLEVQDELGRGGFGVVLRARELATGREVALKLMLDPSGPDALARFTREGELLARLDHPGIVRVHAAAVDQGRPFLVCELVPDARSLAEAADGAPLAERVRLVRDAARALGHAHARGIVHRDVKPANLLVDREGRVRVTDFGLAAAADLERLTQSGYVVGTPLYLAPEQLRDGGAPPSPTTDVWSLGVILFELAAGRPPFPSDNLVELFARLSSWAAPSLRAAAPDASPALEAVVARALARDPAARFPDGAALADALDRAQAAPAGPARRSPTRALPVLLLGLLAGGGVVALATRAPLAPAPVDRGRGRAPASPAPLARTERPPPDRTARWSAGVVPEAEARTLRTALDALDAELAAGRPPDPAEREAVVKVLGELDRRWKSPAALSKGIVEALSQLLWTHALWVRLDPTHTPSPERARSLLDAVLILAARPETGRVGAELARVLPRELNGYVLHADAWSTEPGRADGPLLRRGLALAEDGPPDTWGLLARVLAGWLAWRADKGDVAARDELLRLAEEVAAHGERSPRAVAHARALAARHAPPALARRLLLEADAAGSAAPEERVVRALGWWRLARAPALDGAVVQEARVRAHELSWAAFEELVREADVREQLLGPVAVALVETLPPDEALGVVERCLAVRTTAFAGLALRRVLLLAERYAADGELATALADLAPRLDATLRGRRPGPAREGLRVGVVLARALGGLPSGQATAVRERLRPWATPELLQLVDR